MTIGIYALQCRETGKLYIGQSNDIEGRIHTHFTHLKRGQHHNTKLQEAFWEYGMAGFEAYTIQECEIDELNEREEYYIKYYRNTEDGVFNSKRAVKRTRNKVKRIIQMPIKRQGWTVSLIEEWQNAGEPNLVSLKRKTPNHLRYIFEPAEHLNGLSFFEAITQRSVVYRQTEFPLVFETVQRTYTPDGTQVVTKEASEVVIVGKHLGLTIDEILSKFKTCVYEDFEKTKI